MSYIFAAARRWHFALNAQLKSATGLHASEYEVLRLIGEEPGIIQARIADRLGVDPRTVGDIIWRFKEKLGWVQIKPALDNRSTSVALTDDGIQARSDARLKAIAIEQALCRISGKPIEKLTAEIEALSRLGGDLVPAEIKQAEAA